MNKLVLDIGGTAIKYAVMDNDANIITHGEHKTPLDALDSLLDVIYEIYAEVKDDVDGLAISMPGNLDSETGQVYAPGALTYNAGINFVDALKKRIPLPVAIENDGKSAALAEVWKGNLKECQDGVVLILGTGIGGGIIHDRKVIKGKHFFAGEVSYLKVNVDGNGFENVFAMEGSTVALVMHVAAAKGIDFNTIDGKIVFEWIKEKDPVALKCFDKMTKTLASQIYNLQCLLDPEKILIGGGVSKQSILFEAIQKHLDDIYSQLPFPIPQADIMPCAFNNDSNLIGALYHYKQHYGEL